MKTVILFFFVLCSFYLNAQTISIVPLNAASTCDTNYFKLIIVNNTNTSLNLANLILDIDPHAVFASNYATSINGDLLSLRGNSFNTHGTGLKYSNAMNPGIQNYGGNQWFGTYSPVALPNPNFNLPGGGGAAYNGNYSTTTPINNELFFISNPQGSPFFPSNVAIYPSSSYAPFTVSWFNSGSSQTDFDCANGQYLTGGGGGNTNALELIAKGDYELPEYKEALNLQAQRILYEKIEKDEVLLGTSTKIDSFYLANNSTAVKALYEAKELEESKQEATQSETQALELIKVQLETLLHALDLLDSLHRNDSILDLTYLSQKEVLQIRLDSLSFEAGALSTQKYAVEEILTDAAKQKYQDAVEIYTVDYNTKYVGSVYLESFAKGVEIDPIHYQELEIIASQCPAAGGKSVFIARNMLQSIYEDSIFVWDDDLRCLVQGYEIRKQPLEEEVEVLSKDNIQIYPNPSNGTFGLYLDLENQESLTIQCLDMLGRLILEHEVLYNTFISIDLSSSKGIYLIKVFQNNTIIHQEKLIIK